MFVHTSSLHFTSVKVLQISTLSHLYYQSVQSVVANATFKVTSSFLIRISISVLIFHCQQSNLLSCPATWQEYCHVGTASDVCLEFLLGSLHTLPYAPVSLSTINISTARSCSTYCGLCATFSCLRNIHHLCYHLRP